MHMNMRRKSICKLKDKEESSTFVFIGPERDLYLTQVIRLGLVRSLGRKNRNRKTLL